MPPMAEAAAQASNLLDVGVAMFGFGGLGGIGIVGFIKLRTEVRLYRDENQKDHKEIKNALKEINGRGRDNTTAIAEANVRCEERHS